LWTDEHARIGIATGTLAGLSVAGLVLASAASATVSFDPTGSLTPSNSQGAYGFVGNGDVNTAFGWNNQKLQKQAGNLSFSYNNNTEDFSAVCEWTTGTGTRGQQTHDITVPRQTSISDSIDYLSRTNQQVDGFLLTGAGIPVLQGTVPVVGAACVGNTDGVDFNGTWTSVTDNGSLGGGLYVS
jgi:hypothetical protein